MKNILFLVAFFVLSESCYGQDHLNFSASNEEQMRTYLKRQLPKGTSVEAATRFMVRLGFACYYRLPIINDKKTYSGLSTSNNQHRELFCQANFPYEHSKGVLSAFVTRAWRITFSCVDEMISEPYVSLDLDSGFGKHVLGQGLTRTYVALSTTRAVQDG